MKCLVNILLWMGVFCFYFFMIIQSSSFFYWDDATERVKQKKGKETHTQKKKGKRKDSRHNSMIIIIIIIIHIAIIILLYNRDIPVLVNYIPFFFLFFLSFSSSLVINNGIVFNETFPNSLILAYIYIHIYTLKLSSFLRLFVLS